MSFADLLNEYNIERIDLLQIDTEGYDSEIIRGLDFSKIKPSFIHFEHGEGVMSKEDFSEVLDILHRNGYEIAMEPNDVTAYQMDAIIDF